MIQSLENFVSMAIQGTQVPMYTNIQCFCIFLIFHFYFYFYEKQNKAKLKINKQTCFTKQSIKLDWLRAFFLPHLQKKNKQQKHTSNATQKQERGEREKKWLNHLEHFSFHTLEEPFRLMHPWSGGEGEELKPFKFERNSDRSKRGWKLILVSR